VNAIQMLAQLLDTVNLRLHHSAGDLTPDELTTRAVAGVNPIAFIVWHMARSQDWAVNTAIRDLPEVVTRVPWRSSSVAVAGIGTGFDHADAEDVARRVNLQDLLGYADAVHADSLAWLRTQTESVLDEIPDVAAHDAPHPE
jgi:hypothetical protein